MSHVELSEVTAEIFISANIAKYPPDKAFQSSKYSEPFHPTSLSDLQAEMARPFLCGCVAC